MTGELDEQALAFQATVAGTLSLEMEIGRGGMGVVYLAREVALDRPVAVKLLRTDLARDEDARARFLREAATAARLVHPHIIPVYDVGESGDLAWIVMGYVDGESLADRLQREGPMPAQEATRVLREIGWALAAAHAAGVLHRDVTLSNILVERATGRALLADFGLAEPRDAGEAGQLIGTPEYLAPELLHAEAPSPRSDLYALGITGWALCTGHLPISGDSPAATLMRRLQEEPPPLGEVAPGLPAALRRAVDAALSTDPAQRPASMEDWLATLDDATPVRTLALPLARWVESGEFARPYYAFAFSLAGMMLVTAGNVLHSLFYPFFPGIPVPLVMVGLALVMGALVHLGLSVTATRRAAQAGYVLTDLRVALADALRRRIARGVVHPSLVGRVVHDVTTLAGIAAMAQAILWGGVLSFELLRSSPTLYALWWLAEVAAPWLWLTWFVGLAVGRVVPSAPDRPRALRWRLREVFWNSRLGALLFRGISAGLGKQVEAPHTLHRPTEVMLQVGISDLCAALPAPQRHALGEVPALADRLQRRVGRVRERIALLESAGMAGEPEAAALRDRLVEHRDTAIAALERIRRDLLRLGAQVAPTGPLSDQLRQIRLADQRLLEALQSLP